MTEINCTLVGFRHHAWRGMALDNRIAHAQGRQIILMRDSDNLRNTEAAVACIDNKVVAYVSNDDCHRIGAYIDATEFGLLYGRITRVDTSEYRCTALIEVDQTLEETPMPADRHFEEWNRNWSHMPLAPLTDEELSLGMLQRHLLTQLTSQQTNADMLYRDIDLYMATTRYDISAEASNNRRTVTDMLLCCHNEALRQYGQRMETAITAMGNNEVCADIAHYITHNFAHSRAMAYIERRYGTMANSELEHALAAMPYNLHSEYTLSTADFVSRAYYLHIPRQALRRFICTELLLYRNTKTKDHESTNHDIMGAATEYIGRINGHVTNAWQNKTATLWHEILDRFAARITRLNGVKDTPFNARFICQVTGRLIDLGVYDDTISQAEYGRIMTLNGKNMRSSINRGLIDDPDTRKIIGMMIEKHRKSII